jgi:hypothetical protein
MHMTIEFANRGIPLTSNADRNGATTAVATRAQPAAATRKVRILHGARSAPFGA